MTADRRQFHLPSPGPILWTGTSILALLVLRHLGGGFAAAILFSGFVAFTFIPAVIVVARALTRMRLPDELCVPSAICAVFVLTVPWMLARKLVGSPVVLDTGLSLLLLPAYWKQRDSLRQIREEVRAAWLWYLVVIPASFVVAWLGWSVPSAGVVRFYGLYVIDFGNLTAVVTSLRCSPMLPQSLVAGAGPLPYHWFFFAIPTVLSDWMGSSIPNANALILANLIAAMTLFFTLRRIAAAERERASASAAAAFVLFAPSSVYLRETAAQWPALRFLELPERNHLLLSPLNSMIVFGNNTVALILCAMAVSATAGRLRTGKVSYSLVAAVCVALLPGYSITLVFPLIAGCTVALLLGGARDAMQPLAIHGAIGMAALGVFHVLGLLSSPAAGGLTVALDGGAFTKTAALGLIPVWVMALLGVQLRRPGTWALTAAGCMLVPSILFVAGSPTGNVDFSMKIGSLLPILMLPVVARAFSRGTRVWVRSVIAITAMVGAAHSVAYVGQFAYYRVCPVPGRSVALPTDYVDALEFLRTRTPREAVVVDSESMSYSQAIPTLMLGERRVWMPTPYTIALRSSPYFPERRRAWTRIAGGSRQPEDARAIEHEAAYVLTRVTPMPSWWRQVYASGDVSIFRTADVR